MRSARTVIHGNVTRVLAQMKAESRGRSDAFWERMKSETLAIIAMSNTGAVLNEFQVRLLIEAVAEIIDGKIRDEQVRWSERVSLVKLVNSCR